MLNIKNNKKTIIIAIIVVIFAIFFACAAGSYFLYIIFSDNNNNSRITTNSETSTYKMTDNDQTPAKNDSDSSINDDKISENNNEPMPDIIEDTAAINDKNEIIRSAGITDINQQNLFDTQQVETFSVDSAKFIIYPLKDISATEQEEGYFEAYQDINLIYSSDKLYNIAGIFSFNYNSDTYIVVTSYSGGAHCCFTEYIFYKDANEKLTLIRELATNNATISPDSFLVKNNNLYLSIMDDRFAYFYTSYASSYSFVQFFQLDDKNLTSANGPFEDEFLKEAGRCETELNAINPADIYSMEDWFPTLLCKVSNYWYSGDQNKAWSGFNDYFTKFGASENPNDIRTEIENILKQNYN